MQKFSTVRFGELTYRQEDVIHLPDGLTGLPDLCDWLILEMGQNVPMMWFQSLDRADFGFPVCNPDLFVDDYGWELTPSQTLKVSGDTQGRLVPLVIATIHEGGERITGNLLAPLVIDSNSRRGVQAPQPIEQYGLQQEINYLKFGLAVSRVPGENMDQNGQAKEVVDSCPETVEAQVVPKPKTPETVGA